MAHVLLFRNGLIGGLLSGAATFLPWAAVAWAPGVIFGVSVLLAFLGHARNWRISVARATIFVAFSTIAYCLAFVVQLEGSRFGAFSGPAGLPLLSGVAGLTGTSLMAASLPFVLNIAARPAVLLPVLLVGAATGAVFGGLLVALPGDNFFWPLKMIAGFVIWQSCTAMSLGGMLQDLGRTASAESDEP